VYSAIDLPASKHTLQKGVLVLVDLDIVLIEKVVKLNAIAKFTTAKFTTAKFYVYDCVIIILIL